MFHVLTTFNFPDDLFKNIIFLYSNTLYVKTTRGSHFICLQKEDIADVVTGTIMSTREFYKKYRRTNKFSDGKGNGNKKRDNARALR